MLQFSRELGHFKDLLKSWQEVYSESIINVLYYCPGESPMHNPELNIENKTESYPTRGRQNGRKEKEDERKHTSMSTNLLRVYLGLFQLVFKLLQLFPQMNYIYEFPAS